MTFVLEPTSYFTQFINPPPSPSKQMIRSSFMATFLTKILASGRPRVAFSLLTLLVIRALLRLRLFIHTSLLGSYMRKSAGRVNVCFCNFIFKHFYDIIKFITDGTIKE